MKSRAAIFALVPVIATLAIAPLYGCDDLALPVQPDAGGQTPPPNVNPDSGPTQNAEGLVPAGAFVSSKHTSTFNSDELYSFATVDGAGKVAELTVVFPLSVVRAVPPTIVADDIRIPASVPSIVAEQTAIRSLSYNYRPQGHSPPGVYDTPHWELHPALLSEQEMAGIDCTDTTPPNEAAFMPEDWAMIPEAQGPCVPTMGRHAINRKSAEFNGERFKHGLLIAVYKGGYTTLEPKWSKEMLLRHEETVTPVPDVKSLGLSAPTMWPTKMTTKYNAEHDSYLFSFSDWVQKQ